ncbi:MAG TPA: OsmC family protein [Solirubrobacterales bacterium]|jgi:putative redox protein|nr:OsmC family protein [Solirubrobacterales bacterium]
MASASTRRTGKYATAVEIRSHRLIADEPSEVEGGTDAGPTPTEFLAASLASCTAITMELYAEHKGWELGAVDVDVDWPNAIEGGKQLEVEIRVPAELSDEQRERLLVIAGRCPVHRLLESKDVEITDSLELLEP